MPTDNTDSVSMDFLIAPTLLLACRVQKYTVNTVKVARTGDVAHGRQVICGYITYTVVAT